MNQNFMILTFFLTFWILLLETQAKNLKITNEEVEVGRNLGCTPAPRPDSAQYIVGYGSLINTASKDRTVWGTGKSIPVRVQGFRREWNLKGRDLGPSTTYLGVVPDPKSSFNGVVFQLKARNISVEDAIKQFDAREKYYCRKRVELKDIQALGGQTIGQASGKGQSLGSKKGPSTESVLDLGSQSESGSESETEVESDGQKTQPEPELGSGAPNSKQRPKPRSKTEFWIYVNKPENIDRPSKEFPIVQSYVDVFLSGCLEFQEKYNLNNFAKNCVDSTKGWSDFWVNDRLYPRRPFVHQPLAGKIDAILKEKLPVLFEKIQLEAGR